MEFLAGNVKNYSWGSHRAIPTMFGLPASEAPVAELWFGAHPLAPSFIGRQFSLAYGQKTPTDVVDLATHVAAAAQRVLGEDVARRTGGTLPFLLKLIAPEEPLSLQVHPSIDQAQRGFACEEAQGVPANSPTRNYKDSNHKPELVYALTRFEAIVGFRSPRRILGVLSGLGTALTQRLAHFIEEEPNANGVKAAFEWLLSSHTRPDAVAVGQVVDACQARAPEESPSPRADRIVAYLAQYYPGDPGVVASLLLNPVTLSPGEAMFTPAGTVHAYLSGVGVEVMAASDNVMRAGLTPKHVDVPALLSVLDTVAAPPIRIAPERVSPIQSMFYAPVDDFELSVIALRDASSWERVRGSGPRIMLCLEGAAQIRCSGETLRMNTGSAVFIEAADGGVELRGVGKFVQADVP
ncbi:mannose-6-phosphate isomerase, class I [Arcanobacterium canis]